MSKNLSLINGEFNDSISVYDRGLAYGDGYFAKLFCYSFGTSIFIYVVINMSMVLGLLPIVGSPLPIMSYGGSSMLATMIGFGIVMSAKTHSQQSIA